MGVGIVKGGKTKTGGTVDRGAMVSCDSENRGEDDRVWCCEREKDVSQE